MACSHLGLDHHRSSCWFLSLSLLMTVLFLDFCFPFDLLVFVAWNSENQHDLWYSSESLSKSGTRFMAASLASGAAGDFCQSWRMGWRDEKGIRNYRHWVSWGGSLVACLFVVLEAAMVSGPAGSLWLSLLFVFFWLSYLALVLDPDESCTCSSDWCGLLLWLVAQQHNQWQWGRKGRGTVEWVLRTNLGSGGSSVGRKVTHLFWHWSIWFV